MRRNPLRQLSPRPLAITIAIGGTVLSVLLTWAASGANNGSTTRLLQLQVRQTAAALGAAIPSIQSQLNDALQVASATNSPAVFKRFVASKVSAKSGFASISLWQKESVGAKLLTVSGPSLRLVTEGDAAAFFDREKPSALLHATSILRGTPARIGFAYMPTAHSKYIVYAELLLPASRKLVIPKSSAFNDLNFALYVGNGEQTSQLVFASIGTPIEGLHAVASTPFGDTALTLVGTPKGQLTGGLSASLSWIVLVVGLVVSLGSAATVDFVIRKRGIAEALAKEVSGLYAQQRAIADTLQHALVPEVLPNVPGMEIAVRYLPGAAGVDIGGDWYDVIPIDKGRFVFTIGDVSGRGVRAAAVMASLHHASRGFAVEGHSPDGILEHLSSMLNVEDDDHFATVLCGLVDVERHEVTLANAGHLPPILCERGRAARVETKVSQPIGVSHRLAIESTVLRTSAGAILLAYTDGLVERRGQLLNEGITRLEVVASATYPTAHELLSSIVAEFSQDSPDDDIALIGIRWLN